MSRSILTLVLSIALVLGACGDDDAAESALVGTGRPTVVVTTSLLADVVESFAGEQVDVIAIMPPGADPHVFQASARNRADMSQADVLVVSGAGFEEGLEDVIDAVSGEVPTFVAADSAGGDPHFFTDPVLVHQATEALAVFLAEQIDGIDAGALAAQAGDYLDELEQLDAEVAEILDAVQPAQRTMVTGHDVFGPFAARYGFGVVGTVIPGAGTGDSASAAELDALARLIERTGVLAIFTEDPGTANLAETVAAEVGVPVVGLFAESLGPDGSGADSYLGMVRTNAERIAEALGDGA